MIDRRQLLTLLLTAAAVGLLVLWYRGLEWETRQVDLGPTREAQQNPVLALQRLLEERAVPVTLVRGFGGIERMTLNNVAVGSGDSLVLLNAGRSLRQAQVNALWDWVEGGGRLLVAAGNPFAEMDGLGDPLLDRLGVAPTSDYWDEMDDEGESEAESGATAATEGEADAVAKPEETAETPPREKCEWNYVVRTVSLPDLPDTELRMEFGSATAFTAEETAARTLAADGDYLFFLQQRLGAGDLYLLPSPRPLENDTILCEDNAFALWHLLKDSEHVWLVLNTDSPSFWYYLWRLSALGCVLSLAALVVWLWYRVPRFGPLLEARAEGRRQFMDHIHASAQFILRHQGSGALVETLREDLWQRMRHRHPGLERLNQVEQLERIRQFSGMAAADVHLALFRELPVPPPELVELVQRLQHLRNAL